MRSGVPRRAAVLAAAAVALIGCSSSNTTAGSGPLGNGVTASAAAGSVHRLGPADFEAQATDRMLINVHIPDEGSLPGTALNLPYNEVSTRAGQLPADKATPLAIYCMTDHMSGIAGSELLRLGYTDIIELDGGMQAWQASGRTLLPAGS